MRFLILGSLFVSISGIALWHVARCRHPHPALQPAIREADGHLHPSRWFCHDCGHSWPAVFEKVQTPVVRFSGYDESKAVDAARRAREFERRQRELAMDRAGMSDAQPTAAPVLVRGRRAS